MKALLAALAAAGLLATSSLASGGPTITSAQVVAPDTVEITYVGVAGQIVNIEIRTTLDPHGTQVSEVFSNTGDVDATVPSAGTYYFAACQGRNPCSAFVQVVVP